MFLIKGYIKELVVLSVFFVFLFSTKETIISPFFFDNMIVIPQNVCLRLNCLNCRFRCCSVRALLLQFIGKGLRARTYVIENQHADITTQIVYLLTYVHLALLSRIIIDRRDGICGGYPSIQLFSLRPLSTESALYVSGFTNTNSSQKTTNILLMGCQHVIG